MTNQGSAGVKPADFEQLEDKEESVVSGQKHNKINVTTAQIPKYRVTWLLAWANFFSFFLQNYRPINDRLPAISILGHFTL